MFTTSSCAFLPVPPFLSSSVIYWLLTSLHLLLLETSWVWFQWFQSCALSLSSFNPSSPLLINTPTLQALLLPGLPKEDSKKQQLKTPTLPQMQRPPCRTVGWCSRPPTPLRGLPSFKCPQNCKDPLWFKERKRKLPNYFFPKYFSWN